MRLENNMPIFEEEQKKQIEEIAKDTFNKLNKSGTFIDRRVIDNPTESLSPVNRRYLTLNGVVADRPKSSVATIGQPYFATDTFIPMTYSAAGWRNGVGSIVAINN